jgi:hypothetical protein
VTEIYLCNVCSCQEILRRNGRGQSLNLGISDEQFQAAMDAMDTSRGADDDDSHHGIAVDLGEFEQWWYVNQHGRHKGPPCPPTRSNPDVDLLEIMAEMLHSLPASPGDMVVEEGRFVDRVYILHQGKVVARNKVKTESGFRWETLRGFGLPDLGADDGGDGGGGGGGGGGGDSQVCISYEHSDPVFGLQAVSHSCACIGSPCLRHCVHGASIGARGGGACHRSAALTLHGGLLARRRAHGVPLHQPRRHHGVLWHVAGGTGFLAGACTCARTKHKASPSLTCQLRASSAHTRLKRHVSLDPGPA